MTTPHLFGLNRSNRDFSNRETWGKNQFNSSFPAALCCYMADRGISANYLCAENGRLSVRSIGFEEVFGINPLSPNAYFAFETAHSPFQKYVVGTLPRTDLVVQDFDSGNCLSGLEIKLTALPDNTTCRLDDARYGSEIVIRPDSIVYLACSIADAYGQDGLSGIADIVPDTEMLDWSEPATAAGAFPHIRRTLQNICENADGRQKPFLLQPIWKTEGKSPRLAEDCLDVFVWSDAAFVGFIQSLARLDMRQNGITRQARTAVWLYKMLEETVRYGRFNHEKIIDTCSYNTKNDKAFAASGQVTNPFMKSPRLTRPIIGKNEIKNIILGGGQEMLSPERRFDAIIYNSPELFL
ncbi:MAG: HindVP family restriction endonuclease [Neisseria sp.]|nr:HindVP family restriction endonuclease [Neisseria sp.]